MRTLNKLIDALTNHLARRNAPLTDNSVLKILQELALKDCLLSPALNELAFDNFNEMPLEREDYSIGFACNIANNSYILAKALVRKGKKTFLFWEPNFTDYYPLSNPVWEDIEYTADTEPKSVDFLLKKWVQPDFVLKANYGLDAEMEINFDYEEMRNRFLGAPINISDSPLLFLKLHSLLHHKEMFRLFAKADVLHVSGYMTGLASLTEKPYVTFPYGSDLYTLPFQNDMRGWMQVQGFRRANMHIATGKLMLEHLEKLGVSRKRIALLPFMYDTDLYSPLDNNQLRDELKIKYPGKIIFFLGARQNWIWKGNDKFFKAVAKVKDIRDKAVFITTWWGQDTSKSEVLIKELKLDSSVKKIGVCSKPSLRKYIDATDVCVDQFTLGSFGTFSLESMSMEKPLLTYFNPEKHFNFEKEPPILNALTENQIYEILSSVLDNALNIKDLGKQAREWIKSYHSIEALWPEYDKVYKTALNDFRGKKIG